MPYHEGRLLSFAAFDLDSGSMPCETVSHETGPLTTASHVEARQFTLAGLPVMELLSPRVDYRAGRARVQ